MRADYAEWIRSNVVGTGKNQCRYYAELMARAFHELRFIGGTYTCPIEGEWRHCFTVTRDTGEIVDPTAAQFESNGRGKYNYWKSFSDTEIAWLKTPNGDPLYNYLRKFRDVMNAGILNRLFLNNELWKQDHTDLDRWEKQWRDDTAVKTVAFTAFELSRAAALLT